MVGRVFEDSGKTLRAALFEWFSKLSKFMSFREKHVQLCDFNIITTHGRHKLGMSSYMRLFV